MCNVSFSPFRTVLENFSHLSERDLSILHKYPLHRVGSLLKGEESRSVAASLRHLLDGQARSEPAKKRGPKLKKVSTCFSIQGGRL